MKVLYLTNDPTILDQGSSGHARVRDSALAIGELHVLSYASVSEQRDEGSLRIRTVHKGFFSQQVLKKTAESIISEHNIHAIWVQDPFDLGKMAATLAEHFSLPLFINVETNFLSPWYERNGIFRAPTVHMPRANRARRTHAGAVLMKAKGIRVMSDRLKNELIKEYGTHIPEPVVIPIRVGTSLPDAVPLPGAPFPFSLMVAGRLEPQRRVYDVLAALRTIKDLYPGVGLFVVGDGPERTSLERYARHHGLEDRVVFLGDRRDTWGLMRSAHAFIQASAYEGYGRRLLQAALARVPIITTDVGIVGEVFKGYDDVLAMPPGDPAALAVHIVGLLHDASARTQLAMSAETSAKTYLQNAGNIPEREAVFLGAIPHSV